MKLNEIFKGLKEKPKQKPVLLTKPKLKMESKKINKGVLSFKQKKFTGIKK